MTNTMCMSLKKATQRQARRQPHRTTATARKLSTIAPLDRAEVGLGRLIKAFA